VTVRRISNPSPLAGEGGARCVSSGRVRGQHNKASCSTPSSVKAAGATLPPSPARGEGKLQQRAKQMRKAMTPAERKLWYALRGRRLSGYKFRRQVPIGNYIADFVCLRPKLIVEVDGGQHNNNSYDKVRDNWLRAQGFRVTRFWNPDVLKNLNATVETILNELKNR